MSKLWEAVREVIWAIWHMGEAEMQYRVRKREEKEMSDTTYMCRICGASGKSILHMAVVSGEVDQAYEGLSPDEYPGPWHWEILEHDGSRRAKSYDEFDTRQEAWDDLNNLIEGVIER